MKNEILKIQLPDAKEILRRGLKWAIGEKAIWRPEYDKVADWLSDNKHKGLLCFGSDGLGKTLICDDIMENIFRYYLRKNYIKLTAFQMKDHIEDINDSCSVFIDDVGIEPTVVNYGERYEPFVEIIYNAERNGQLLVLTTNLNPKQLTERYGERTFNRLSAIVRPIVFTGGNLRK